MTAVVRALAQVVEAETALKQQLLEQEQAQEQAQAAVVLAGTVGFGGCC